MPEHPYHESLHLKNFTVFKDAQFDFSPGVNAIIGENGSGKTHLLKAMYAYQRPVSREAPDIAAVLGQLFQTDDIRDILRNTDSRSRLLDVSGKFNLKDWGYRFDGPALKMQAVNTSDVKMPYPVYIPALDMMGHTKGFQEAYNRVFLDFDLTCYDILNLFNLKSRDTKNGDRHSEALTKYLGGEISVDESTRRFYLSTPTGRVEMPLVAEGIRKIASLVRLRDNNWLTPGTTLYWDEPEVNLNPILMEAVVESVISMAQAGVQVFITTHSYVILKELDLQATPEVQLRFFSLKGNKKQGTQVTFADDLAGLEPNSILAHYGSLYDRDLDRALGKEPRRAKM